MWEIAAGARSASCGENPLLRYQKRRDTTSGVLKYDLSTLQRGIGVFAKAKIPTPCVWQASLPIFGWRMRTPTYRVCRSGLHLQKSHLLYCYKLTSPRMAIYRHRRYAQSANFAFGEGRLFLNIFELVSLIPFQNKKPTTRVGS